jgi:alpha-amylase
MSPSITFYFQVHQPYRLRDLRYTDVGRDGNDYFDHEKNSQVFRKVAEKCYLPTNKLMLEMLNEHPEFRIAYSLSGVFMDQCEEYGQDVLDSFKALAETGKVEFLAETYYHSLSYLKSVKEFSNQVRLQAEKVERLFGQRPRIFRNTELIYGNELAEAVRQMGFRGMISEGVDRLLYGRSPNEPFVPNPVLLEGSKWDALNSERFHATPSDKFHVLLKNYRLSDDVAFRFSDRSWVGYPLDANRFTDWLMDTGGHTINLFMDYETFGEHQWADTGIFDFLRALPRIWQERGIRCTTPSMTIDEWGDRQSQTYDAHSYISWADTERDLSAWLSNGIQNAAFESLYALEHPVRESKDPELLSIWRKLQTSDHLYYMCTKYWHDGDVHKYFSPYDSPYEAYRRFSHAVCDLRERLRKRSETLAQEIQSIDEVRAEKAEELKKTARWQGMLNGFLDLFDFLNVPEEQVTQSVTRNP